MSAIERASQMVRSAVNAAAGKTEEEADGKPRIGMVVDMSDANFIGGFIPSLVEKQRYPYSRPEFLYFSDDEIVLSADQSVRPVLCPKIPTKMPLYAGYAEVINAGKTVQNEDQATARLLTLVQQGFDAEEAKEESTSVASTSKPQADDEKPLISSPDEFHSPRSSVSVCAPRAEAALFAILDGHAGSGAASVASKCLHEHVKSRLSEVLETIIHLDRHESLVFGRRSESSYSIGSKNDDYPVIKCDQLVCGALEAAFVDMDEQIEADKQLWRLPGGCAALAALVFLGKLYVANAGDCRAVLVTSEGSKPLSQDFTPATERKRLQSLAHASPELIGNSFSRLEYSRRLSRRDLKTKVLYRDWFMEGWAAKTVKEADLRPPLICNNSRKKRLLNTIGVSRGFGDHHLMTVDQCLPIKPFLSPVPEVRVFDLRRLDSLDDRDVLILASDGLWDVLSNEDAGLIVRSSLSSTEPSDATRYCMAAQELVIAARGNPSGSHGQRWSMNSGGPASTDDITVFVIPLKHCVAPPPAGEEDDDDDMISLCGDS